MRNSGRHQDTFNLLQPPPMTVNQYKCLAFTFIIAYISGFLISYIRYGKIAEYFGPKAPDFSVQSFSFTYSPPSAPTFNVRFQICNPNSKNDASTYYKDFLVLFYQFNHNDHDLIFSAVVPPFHQAVRNLTTVDLIFPMNVIGSSGVTGGEIFRFHVEAFASVCFGVAVCKEEKDATLKVLCDEIEVAVAVARGGYSGEMRGGGQKKCEAMFSYL